MWREFVELAEKREVPFATLCARFGVSRKTGYKWLNRFRKAGEAGLAARSRRPRTSPRRTPEPVIEAVLTLRRAQPDWTVARIRAELEDRGITPLPAPSTIDLILRRHREDAAARHQELGPEARRVEPNYRWLFKEGPVVELAEGATVVPFSAYDETTRFWVGATAMAKVRDEERIAFCTDLFRRYGLPWHAVLTREEALRGAAACRMHTPFSVWLMRLGVIVEFSFAQPGDAAKEVERQQLIERLARLPAYQRGALAERLDAPDLHASFMQTVRGWTLARAAAQLDRLRNQHNFGGKQEAMQRRSPISIYRPSSRVMPAEIPLPAYVPEAQIRLVSEKGTFAFQRRVVQVGRAFAGLCVELKLTPLPEGFAVLFAGQVLGQVDLAGAPGDGAASLELTAV